jgi:tryptophan 2,3-dioxygenase
MSICLGVSLGHLVGQTMNELTYASYLKLNKLLNLQEPRSTPAEHDELLFIIVHQTYELWFKLMLHELEHVRAELIAGELWQAVAGFKRLVNVMHTLVEQMNIVETMTPMSFNSFRDRLDTASGFQSAQFREVEFFLGYKRADVLKYQPDPAAVERLRKRLNEPSINDAFYIFLEKAGINIPPDVKQRDVILTTAGNVTVQDGLLRLYKSRPDMEVLFELMTDFDEGLQEWRYRHVKLVERTIGSKQGTGGSPGVEFLKKSLFLATFPDLWAIRHKL